MTAYSRDPQQLCKLDGLNLWMPKEGSSLSPPLPKQFQYSPVYKC